MLSFLLERGRQESVAVKSQSCRSASRVSTFDADAGEYKHKCLLRVSRSNFFQFLFEMFKEGKEGFNIGGRVKLNLVIK